MTKEELKKEAEKKYCNGCKWRIEQCLWAWRNTNGLNEPNEKNCSCKEVPAYLAGAEPREKQIQIDAEQIRALQKQNGELADNVKELEKEIKEWKDKADLWCKTANLKDHNIMINKELEKENADLKEEINKIAFARGNLEEENAELKKDKDYFSDALDKQIEATLKIDAKLKRAKEIIECLLNVFPYDMPEEELDSGDKDMVKEAEEFLKEGA